MKIGFLGLLIFSLRYILKYNNKITVFLSWRYLKQSNQQRDSHGDVDGVFGLDGRPMKLAAEDVRLGHERIVRWI